MFGNIIGFAILLFGVGITIGLLISLIQQIMKRVRTRKTSSAENKTEEQPNIHN